MVCILEPCVFNFHYYLKVYFKKKLPEICNFAKGLKSKKISRGIIRMN